jgi:hypothetical protein
MKMPEGWPERIQEYLQGAYGDLTDMERLGGMSDAEVSRLQFRKKSVILKVSTRPGEAQFYKRAAPVLRGHAIPLPYVELNIEANSVCWLVLEDVPQPLPRERWFCDSEMLMILNRLHTLDLKLPTMFNPVWTDTMTEKALACFGNDEAARFKTRLNSLQALYQHVFRQECLISADPNPKNWGLRDNGDIMLYDWERFSYGTPAIDLAITVPGLGNMEQFTQVAATYLQERERSGGAYPVPVEQLARDMAAAKLWAVVELLSGYQDGDENTVVRFIVSGFEAWLEGLEI